MVDFHLLKRAEFTEESGGELFAPDREGPEWKTKEFR
jgi:hypothetical protein